jgi:hypothetical protein
MEEDKNTRTGRPKIYKKGKNITLYLDGSEWEIFKAKYGKEAAPLVNEIIKVVNSGAVDISTIVMKRESVTKPKKKKDSRDIIREQDWYKEWKANLPEENC